MTTESEMHRQSLERRADIVRSRLAETLASLAYRRHRWFDWRYQVRHHLWQFAVVGGVLLLVAVGSVVLAVRRASVRWWERWRERFRAVRRWWVYPERVARQEPRPSWVAELARRLLVTMVTAGASELIRAGARRALPAPNEARQG